MIGSPETAALRRRADFLEAHVGEVSGLLAGLMRTLTDEYRALADLAEHGNFAEELPDGRVVVHDHFAAGPEATPCHDGCPGRTAP